MTAHWNMHMEEKRCSFMFLTLLSDPLSLLLLMVWKASWLLLEAFSLCSSDWGCVSRRLLAAIMLVVQLTEPMRRPWVAWAGLSRTCSQESGDCFGWSEDRLEHCISGCIAAWLLEDFREYGLLPLGLWPHYSGL